MNTYHPPQPRGLSKNLIAVVGMPRSATTLLTSSLAQHPELLVADELFAVGEKERAFFHFTAFGDHEHYREGEDVRVYLDQCFDKAVALDKDFVFKLLDYQNPHAWYWLNEYADHIIYVKRDNPLESLVSEKYGQEAGTWHAHTGEEVGQLAFQQVRHGPVQFKPFEIFEWMRKLDRLERILANDRRVLTIPYSYLTKMFDMAMREIFIHIGVAVHPVTQQRLKINDRPLWKSIHYYPLLRKYFLGTQYEFMFPEPPTTPDEAH